MSEPKVSVGRIVHYVMEDGPNAGKCRAAMVSRVWGDGGAGGDTVQMTVFFDGTNDGPNRTPAEWRTSVVHNEAEHALRSWHWPERE